MGNVDLLMELVHQMSAAHWLDIVEQLKVHGGELLFCLLLTQRRLLQFL